MSFRTLCLNAFIHSPVPYNYLLNGIEEQIMCKQDDSAFIRRSSIKFNDKLILKSRNKSKVIELQEKKQTIDLVIVMITGHALGFVYIAYALNVYASSLSH